MLQDIIGFPIYVFLFFPVRNDKYIFIQYNIISFTKTNFKHVKYSECHLQEKHIPRNTMYTNFN